MVVKKKQKYFKGNLLEALIVRLTARVYETRRRQYNSVCVFVGENTPKLSRRVCLYKRFANFPAAATFFSYTRNVFTIQNTIIGSRGVGIFCSRRAAIFVTFSTGPFNKINCINLT